MKTKNLATTIFLIFFFLLIISMVTCASLMPPAYPNAPSIYTMNAQIKEKKQWIEVENELMKDFLNDKDIIIPNFLRRGEPSESYLTGFVSPNKNEQKLEELREYLINERGWLDITDDWETLTDNESFPSSAITRYQDGGVAILCKNKASVNLYGLKGFQERSYYEDPSIHTGVSISYDYRNPCFYLEE